MDSAPAQDPRAARLIGVIHLLPLPGSPRFANHRSVRTVLAAARRDAGAFVAGGVDRLIVENFHDTPFFRGAVPSETVAAMTLGVDAVLGVEGVHEVGVNVLRNDARSALGIAAATGAHFVRVNVHTGTMFTDQGAIEGDAASTVRERERLCPGIRILCDVHVKHATPVVGEALEDAARDTWLRGAADGLIVSGAATGAAPDEERVARVRAAVGAEAPIWVGSGFDVGNASRLLAHANGAIVGTAAKENGDVRAPVETLRVRALVQAASGAR